MTMVTAPRPSIAPSDPFAQAAAEVRLREEQEAAEAARQRAADATLREQRRAEAEAEREQERLRGILNTFITGFQQAVVKAALQKGWRSTAIVAAGTYCAALTSTEDPTDVPKLSPEMTKVIHDKFTYGLSLPRNSEVPEGIFWGQRQDWFTEGSKPPVLGGKIAYTQPSIDGRIVKR